MQTFLNPYSRKVGQAISLAPVIAAVALIALPDLAFSQPQVAPVETVSSTQLLSDTWDVITIQGARVGFGNTRSVSIEENGQTLVKTDAVMNMKLKRLGQAITMKIDLQSVETPSGELVRTRTNVLMGPTPVVTEGEVKNDQLHLTVSTLGKSTKSTLPWSDTHQGIFALERSLQKKPIKPGEKRTLKALAPVFNQVCEFKIEAGDYELTELLNTKKRLLKVSSAARIGVMELKSDVWVDGQGQIYKTFEPLMQQATYRTTRQVALQESEAFEPDLIVGTLIQVLGLGDIDEIQSAQYHVTLEDGDPDEVFPTSAAQNLNSEGLLTVRRVQLANHQAHDANHKPEAADLNANNMIQSDDPDIVKLSKQVLPDEKDKRRIAIALEKLVNELITEKDFTTGLATAADVADSRQGDCTEHAMLLAALARARGIPSRVAMGLVYVERLKSFGYHMWTEVLVDGVWLPLDATLAQGGTGAGHIKLADSNLDGADATLAFLPVVNVMGRLQIKVKEVER